ncbi:ABC transporter substrate-binding protein [Desulfosarcina cetonica]|uniref:ABC transporter substrate-binding protein n=1 Tax=Desulfosarcina cetonica TaxID=90730 RepID=UPI001FEEB5DA|nr:ABC transporter substrate binding protein [Desulfosarcina cetonica]
MIFAETVKALMKMGWIEEEPLPPLKGEETAGLWNWLTEHAKSEYLDFVKNAHYSAKWEDNERETTVNTIIKRLNTRKDIDLMIAMGTWAGKDLANASHTTDTMVVSASDAVSAGIIKSIEDSGFDYVHAYVDPYRYQRQVRVFHDMIGFKRLGVVYENTVDGRSYAAIDMVEKVAKERGFQIERCFAVSDIADAEKREDAYVGCFEQLSMKTDAIYVTVHGGVSSRSIPKIVEIANAHLIPTFSQSGSEEVKRGILACLSQAGFKYVGQFHAETFAKVFNGAKPNDLDQVFEEPKKIAINLKTAIAIGYDPPIDVLGVADEIYEDIVCDTATK